MSELLSIGGKKLLERRARPDAPFVSVTKVLIVITPSFANFLRHQDARSRCHGAAVAW